MSGFDPNPTRRLIPAGPEHEACRSADATLVRQLEYAAGQAREAAKAEVEARRQAAALVAKVLGRWHVTHLEGGGEANLVLLFGTAGLTELDGLYVSLVDRFVAALRAADPTFDEASFRDRLGEA